MDDDSSAQAHVIPLVLIVIILVVVLGARSLVTSPCTNCTTRRTGSSPRPEPERSGDEEPLLSVVEAQDASPGQDDRLQGIEHALARLSAEAGRWKDADARKAEEIEIAHERIAELQQELSASVSQNADLQRRHETLSRDLEGARLFLNTADTFSDSEIIQMLQKLNAELQQSSTFMADRVASIFELNAASPGPEQQIMVDRASESLGSTFAQFLRAATTGDAEVPMYLQIAFQAYLTYRMRWIVSAWTLDEEHSTFIDKIYRRLRETEKQTISGRWRSLTRSYAPPTFVGEPNSLVTSIIAGLSNILLVVGCAATQSDIMSELSSMFEKKILAAITLAGRLNEMMGGVVSGDFEVFLARPGDTFYGEAMVEDVDDDGGDAQRAPAGTGTNQIVLCTSEMGLTKRIQLGNGERKTTTVTKAKVILESFLEAVD